MPVILQTEDEAHCLNPILTAPEEIKEFLKS